MTFDQMVTRLGKYVKDTVHVQWDLQEKKDMINLAYFLVQKEIIKAAPEAHLMWDTMDLVSGTQFYELPPTFGVKKISMKSAASDTEYTPLSKKRMEDVDTKQIFSGGVVVSNSAAVLPETVYTLEGQYFGLYPKPDRSITNGLQIIHQPILSMSAGSEVPRIKVPLHLATVYWATVLMLGDTDEMTSVYEKRLGEIMNDLPLWYNIHTDEPIAIQIGGVRAN